MSELKKSQINNNGLQNFQSSIDYKKYLMYIFSKWYWVLLSVALSLGIVYIFNNNVPHKYRVESIIAFKKDREQGGSQIEGTFGNLNLKNNLNQFDRENDIELVQSFKIIQKTIKKLDFNISYFRKERFFDKELYTNTPFQVIPGKGFNLYDLPIYIEMFSQEEYKVTIEANISLEDTLKYGEEFSQYGLKFRVYKKPDYSFLQYKDETYYFMVHKTKDLAKSFQNKLTISPLNDRKSIIQLSSSGTVPEKETKFLATLIETYRNYQLRQVDNSADTSIKFINQQLAKIEQRLLQYENELQGMRRDNRAIGSRYIDPRYMGYGGNQQQGGFSSLYTELRRLEDQKISIKEKKEHFISISNLIKNNRNIDSIVIPQSAEVEVAGIPQLIEELSNTQKQINASNQNIESNHPLYQSLNQRYEEQKKSLLTKVNTYINYLDKSINKLNQNIAKIEQQLPSYPVKERRYRDIQRRIQQNEEILSTLSDKRIEFEIIKASKSPNFEVLEKPREDHASMIFPNKTLNNIIALIIGLGLPVMILLIKKNNDNKIQEKDEIKNQSHIPILHAVEKNVFNSKLPVYDYKESSIADSFRRLRTNILHRLKEYDRKIIMISSMVSGEGKSFIASNLGAILGMAGFKTVIVNADIRKPTLQKVFSYQNKIGLGDFLINNTEPQQLIQTTMIDNLSIIAPGKSIQNPGDLITTSKIDSLLDYLSKHFEYILFDSPPFSMVPESVLIGERSNCNLFLVRHNYSPKSILEALNEIHQEDRLKNMFLLVNAVKKMKGIGFEYHHGYSSSYGFGHYNKYYTKNKKVAEKIK